MLIAEALNLRKHLKMKVDQLTPIKKLGDDGVLDLKSERIPVSSSSEGKVDELRVQVPKVSLQEVTAEYDRYSKALRLLDTAIQQANFTYCVEYIIEDGINV